MEIEPDFSMPALAGNIHTVCMEGDVQELHILVSSRSVDCEALDNDNCTPLFRACEFGNLPVVQFLVNFCIVDLNKVRVPIPMVESKNDGASPLIIACRNGHFDVVDFLLTNGASVNQTKVRGASPLFIAAQVGHETICRLLVERGALVELATDYGASPLYIACQNGHGNIVKYLIANGAAVDRIRDSNISPLYISCQNGHDAIATILLQAGCDPNICRDGGISPLYIACQNGHVEVVKALLYFSRGLVVNCLSQDGVTPLMIACQNGFMEIVRLLVQVGCADINLTQYRAAASAPTTAFDMACIAGQLEIVRFLAAYGAIRSDRVHFLPDQHLTRYCLLTGNWNQMQFAVDARCPDVVCALLKQGFDPSCFEPTTPSPLQLLAENAHVDSLPENAELSCLVSNAMRPWCPMTHSLYNHQFQNLIITGLMLFRRLQIEQNLFLPQELVLLILSFLRRKDVFAAKPAICESITSV